MMVNKFFLTVPPPPLPPQIWGANVTPQIWEVPLGPKALHCIIRKATESRRVVAQAFCSQKSFREITLNYALNDTKLR